MHAGGWRVTHAALLSMLLAAGTATAAPGTTLTVTAFTGPVVLDAPVVVGLQKGTFAKYGLNVQTVPAASGFEALQKVADGTAQVGNSAATALAQTLGQGARLRSIVASNGDATGNVPTDSYVAVIARGTSGIREGHLEDLRGKKVGVRLRSDFHQYLFSALASKGLDPLSAVTLVDTANLLGALQSGSADAIVGSEPGALRIRQATPGAMLVQRGGNYMQFLELRVVSSQYLATHPGTIKRFITAFVEAAQFVRAHPDEATDLVIAHQQISGLSRETWRTAVGLLNPDVRVSKVTVRALQAAADFAMKIGALKQAPTFGEMFDVRILGQVEREHPELFRDLPPIPDALSL